MSLLKEMFEAGVHFGHQTKFWNPKMEQYIFGAKNKIHVINLDITVKKFEEAVKSVQQEIRNRGTVLFVGTRSQASEIIAEEAVRSGMPFVNHRWLGGMLTNFETVKKSIKKLEVKKALLEKADNGLNKKQLLDLTREVAKLQSSIGGISQMQKIPTMLFIVDTGCHNIAIQEAKKLGIKVVGIVDTNNDPSQVDYVIPGNDDSAKAIRLYTSKIADAVITAKENVVSEIANQAKVELIDEAEGKPAKTVRRVRKSSIESKDAASSDDTKEQNNVQEESAIATKTVEE
jgi:small subunit ribosomal protein S2